MLLAKGLPPITVLPASSPPPNLRPIRLPFFFCCLPREEDNASAAATGDPTPLRMSPKKVSPQLTRWSRARALRSGRRLDWPDLRNKTTFPPSSPSSSSPSSSSLLGKISPETKYDEEDTASPLPADGKPIYMVSDGTGWTAEHSVNAALGQFEYCLVDRVCPVNTHLFSGIEDVDRLMEIIKQAAKEGALVLYTLADPSMAESAKRACKLWEVPSTDILRPTIEAIATHIGASPSGIPRGASGRSPLTEDYFKRIEAIDFTIKQDDGALPKNLNHADIVLVGVSRTGKTPLSIYLSQKGYKVANVPIVMGIELPKTVFEINQDKIFGLTINPLVLQTIRKARAKALGFSSDMKRNYSDMEHVRAELESANKIFAQNPAWPVIEVTGKAIEETAAVVVRIYHDREKECFLPSISKRY